MTAGFSGAEISNLINQAILETVEKKKTAINLEIFEDSRDRVLTGIKRKVNKSSLNKLIQTAIHESGHILACYLDTICSKNIQKVSIVPRGTSQSKSYELSNDSVQGTKEELISIIDKSLGGIFAEEIYFTDISKISGGCGRDLQRATDVAKSMIKQYGMIREDFGIQVIDDSTYLVEHKISGETRDKLDTVVLHLINERSKIVKFKLNSNADKLRILVQNLIEYEELTRSDLELIFEGRKLDTKKRKNNDIIKTIEHYGYLTRFNKNI